MSHFGGSLQEIEMALPPRWVKQWSRVAGLAGIAAIFLLFVFIQLLSLNVFPSLNSQQTYNLLKLIVLLAFAFAVLGVLVWAILGGLALLPTILLLAFCCIALLESQRLELTAARQGAQPQTPRPDPNLANQLSRPSVSPPVPESATHTERTVRKQICRLSGMAEQGSPSWNKDEVRSRDTEPRR